MSRNPGVQRVSFPGARAVLGVTLAAAVAACGAGDISSGPQVEPSFARNGGDGAEGQLVLCKYTAEPTSTKFDFRVSATSGSVPGNGRFAVSSTQTIDLTPSCVTVWAGTGGGEITITEDSPGWAPTEAFYTAAGTIYPEGNSFTFPAPETSEFIVVKNEMDMALGRMTGGGKQINFEGVAVTRGFTIHCDITLSNNLEVNWTGGNHWHLDKPITSAVCIDDPAVEPAPPPAPFDTFIGEGIGRLNGVDGSFVRFTFVDAGEPSGNGDTAAIDIWAPGADPATDDPVLSVSGPLEGGNLQAHYDQPHGSNVNR